MPGISARTFPSAIREPAAHAFLILAPHSGEIFAKWTRDVRDLGPKCDDFIAHSQLDFEQLSEALAVCSFPEFRRQIREFAGCLSQRGIRIEQATAALNRLFDICIPHLIKRQSDCSPLIFAVSRLHALVILIVVAGYADQAPGGKVLPLQKNPIPSADRRHDASAYVTNIYEKEWKRLSRDLHDEVGHDLVLIKLYLEMIALETNKKEFQIIRPRLTEAISIVSHAIDSVRRLVLDLGPAVFDDLGFLPAVRTYVSQFSARTKISVSLQEGDLPEKIPISHQIALYRLLQGALSNVLKHASANRVNVSLGCMKNSVLILVIHDDGVGFDTNSRPGRHSFGLTAMRERVEVLGGRIHIQSKKNQLSSKLRGTRIEVDLPLPGGVK